MSKIFDARLADWKEQIDAELKAILDKLDYSDGFKEILEYALFPGGKRLRRSDGGARPFGQPLAGAGYGPAFCGPAAFASAQSGRNLPDSLPAFAPSGGAVGRNDGGAGYAQPPAFLSERPAWCGDYARRFEQPE